MSAPARLGDSALAMVSAAVGIAAAFATFAIISRTAGAAGFGVWALTGAALFPLRFADLGVGAALTRFVGADPGRAVPRVLVRIAGLALLTVGLAFALCTAAALVIAPELIAATVPQSEWPMARELVPWMVAAGLAQLLATQMSAVVLGLHRYRVVYLAAIATALMQAALVGPMVLRFGIAGYAMLQVLVLALQALVLFLYTAVAVRARQGVEPGRFVPREFLRFALHFNLNTLLATLIDPLAKLLLGLTWTLAAVGTFEMVSRIYAQLRTVLIAPLQPLSLAMIRQYGTDREAFERSYRQCLGWGGALAIGVLVAALPAFAVLRLLLGSGAEALGPVVASVSLAIAASCLAVAGYHAAMATGDLKPVLASTLAYLGGAALAIPALGLVHPLLAVAGHALATLAANLLLARLVARHHGLPAWPTLVQVAALPREALASLRALRGGGAP